MKVCNFCNDIALEYDIRMIKIEVLIGIANKLILLLPGLQCMSGWWSLFPSQFLQAKSKSGDNVNDHSAQKQLFQFTARHQNKVGKIEDKLSPWLIFLVLDA